MIKPKRTPSQIGKTNRTKGADFERSMVRWFKELLYEIPGFEDWDIHRGSQSQKARASDIANVPGLWTECQVSAMPDPKKKLKQAIRDRDLSCEEATLPEPVVLYRRSGSKIVFAYMSLATLVRMAGTPAGVTLIEDLVAMDTAEEIGVTLELESLKPILRKYIAHARTW